MGAFKLLSDRALRRWPYMLEGENGKKFWKIDWQHGHNPKRLGLQFRKNSGIKFDAKKYYEVKYGFKITPEIFELLLHATRTDRRHWCLRHAKRARKLRAKQWAENL